MKPHLRTEARPFDWFQAQFDLILNLDHPLLALEG